MAKQAIRTEKVSIPMAGEAKPMGAWLAVPEAHGPHPAVIVFQEIFGVNAHIRDVTERVAREGYVALAPELFHRQAPGLELGYTQEDVQKGMPYVGQITPAQSGADVRASLAFLRARADVRADRVGAVGFCFGGHIAYAAACATDLRAVAVFYGGRIATPGPGGIATVEKTPGIKGRILCLFGEKDQSIPLSDVEKIRAALADAKVRHEVVVYPGVGHGFFCDQRASYDKAAAHQAWEKVGKLFDDELAR